MRTLVGMVISKDGLASQRYLHQPELRKSGLDYFHYVKDPPAFRPKRARVDAASGRSLLAQCDSDLMRSHQSGGPMTSNW
jgi:hypothetical protein